MNNVPADETQPFRRAISGRTGTQARGEDADRMPRTTAADSRRMAGIRQRDTHPELAVRKALHALGLSYRLNVKALPGRPDVANAARKFAVYVHGCFWHRHPGCRRTTTPTRNREFWLAKFDANVARDRRAEEALRAAGYRVAVVWECETTDHTGLMAKLRDRLDLGPARGAA